ncbi:hypothetical protein PIB30_059117, partial [Stylosanthes scabra]|nr:hypothetical protein [Stylosanthes scabra]
VGWILSTPRSRTPHLRNRAIKGQLWRQRRPRTRALSNAPPHGTIRQKINEGQNWNFKYPDQGQAPLKAQFDQYEGGTTEDTSILSPLGSLGLSSTLKLGGLVDISIAIEKSGRRQRDCAEPLYIVVWFEFLYNDILFLKLRNSEPVARAAAGRPSKPLSLSLSKPLPVPVLSEPPPCVVHHSSRRFFAAPSWRRPLTPLGSTLYRATADEVPCHRRLPSTPSVPTRPSNVVAELSQQRLQQRLSLKIESQVAAPWHKTALVSRSGSIILARELSENPSSFLSHCEARSEEQRTREVRTLATAGNQPPASDVTASSIARLRQSSVARLPAFSVAYRTSALLLSSPSPISSLPWTQTKLQSKTFNVNTTVLVHIEDPEQKLLHCILL